MVVPAGGDATFDEPGGTTAPSNQAAAFACDAASAVTPGVGDGTTGPRAAVGAGAGAQASVGAGGAEATAP